MTINFNFNFFNFFKIMRVFVFYLIKLETLVIMCSDLLKKNLNIVLNPFITKIFLSVRIKKKFINCFEYFILKI